jgi:hypothetical protein
MIESNIRDPKLRELMWNWKPVSDLMPGKMGVSDIDGVCERNGHFMFMEAKRENEGMSLGQEIMLKKLSGLDPDKVRVLVVYGNKHTGEIQGYCRVTPAGIGEMKSARSFKIAFRKWFNKANASVRPRVRRSTF